MSEVLRVAAIQADPIPGDVAANAVAGAVLASEAAARGARVAVLPELFLSAYHPPVLAADPAGTAVIATADRAVEGDGRLDPLRNAARDGGLVLVVGAAVRHDDGRLTCSSLVVDRSGRITVGYDKQNLCGPDEKALFVPGTGGASIRVDGWTLGLGICYDGCFPEHGRAAALDGAEAYLTPTGYLRGSEHRRDVYYAARALDNSMYVVFSNSVDGAAPWSFNGGAAVYDPEGRPVVRGRDSGTEVVVADLDKALVAEVRAAHSMLADRRSDLGTRAFIDVA